ncbi:MAG: NADH-quinone oxidoreductase subunit C [Planctomycetales bacterium]|nr:NADH-quinone oxidoreductase subunit C [Planctomycetales bacterium]
MGLERPPWDGEALDRLAEAVPGSVARRLDANGQASALVPAAKILDALRFLRDDPRGRFEMLLDLAGVDRLSLPDPLPRLEVVYHLYSVARAARVRLSVRVTEEDPKLPTATGLWPAANWFEREVYDLFGITFQGHPNLKRILCHREFVGHPLRKDYPIRKRQTVADPDPLTDELERPRP